MLFIKLSVNLISAVISLERRMLSAFLFPVLLPVLSEIVPEIIISESMVFVKYSEL